MCRHSFSSDPGDTSGVEGTLEPRFPVLLFLVQPHGCGSQGRLGRVVPARDDTKLGVYGNTITIKSLRGFHRTCSSCQVVACRALKWNFLNFSSRVDMVCSIPFPIYRNSPFQGYKNGLYCYNHYPKHKSQTPNPFPLTKLFLKRRLFILMQQQKELKPRKEPSV